MAGGTGDLKGVSPPNRKLTAAEPMGAGIVARAEERRFWSRWVLVTASLGAGSHPDPFLTPLRFQEPPRLLDGNQFVPLDPTQELIFPPELMVSSWSGRAPGER